MTEELAGKVLEAYKTSPLLTGLLILNILTFAAFGWYTVKKDGEVGSFISTLMVEQKSLQKELIDLSRKCSLNG